MEGSGMEVLTVRGTNLNTGDDGQLGGNDKGMESHTPGRPCLTGLYEHENSAR